MGVAQFLRAIAALLTAATLHAQTPPGLLNLPATDAIQSSADRNWDRIYVPSSSLLLLERVHREASFDAHHVAFKSQDFSQLGLLAFPKIKWDKEDPEEALTIYPAIVVAHGSENGVTQPYREIVYEFARRGYVVIAPSFRGHMGIEGRSQGTKEYAKGELLDLLQATQLVRKLPYVNSLRMAIVSFDHGASVAMQAVARSNIFQAAIAVSPVLFSGSPNFSFAGIHRLRSIYLRDYGRNLTEWQLMRELQLRDSFRNVKRFQTPLLLMTHDGDAAYNDQRRYVELLKEQGKEAYIRGYGGVFPGFMTAADNGARPASWRETRDLAWTTLFEFVESRIPGGAEELEEEETGE
jgi:dienelactone hydrolase